MSDNLRLVLGGIVLMLAGLFLLGICVLSGGNGFYPDFPAAICGAAGLVLAAVGMFRWQPPSGSRRSGSVRHW